MHKREKVFEKQETLETTVEKIPLIYVLFRFYIYAHTWLNIFPLIFHSARMQIMIQI